MSGSGAVATLRIKSVARFMRSFDPGDSETDYFPTKADCKHTFDKLNEIIWHGKLPPAKFVIRRLHKSWGIFNGHESTVKHTITLRNRFPNPQLFVATLAHEMIHYWQWIDGSYAERAVHHGKTFWQWRKKFAKHNLPLQEVGGEDMTWYASRNFNLHVIYQKTLEN